MWDCNHTALHMTVESGALEIARLLLGAGADPNIRDDKYHSTALGWAKFFGRKNFAELMEAKRRQFMRMTDHCLARTVPDLGRDAWD